MSYYCSVTYGAFSCTNCLSLGQIFNEHILARRPLIVVNKSVLAVPKSVHSYCYIAADYSRFFFSHSHNGFVCKKQRKAVGCRLASFYLLRRPAYMYVSGQVRLMRESMKSNECPPPHSWTVDNPLPVEPQQEKRKSASELKWKHFVQGLSDIFPLPHSSFTFELPPTTPLSALHSWSTKLR